MTPLLGFSPEMAIFHDQVRRLFEGDLHPVGAIAPFAGAGAPYATAWMGKIR